MPGHRATIARLSPFSSPVSQGQRSCGQVLNRNIVLPLNHRNLLGFLLLLASCAGAPPRERADDTHQNSIEWEPIRTWTGRGDQLLDSFQSDSGALKIDWEAKQVSGVAAPGSREADRAQRDQRPPACRAHSRSAAAKEKAPWTFPKSRAYSSSTSAGRPGLEGIGLGAHTVNPAILRR